MTTTRSARDGASTDDPLLDSAVRRRIVDELSSDGARTLTANQLSEILGLHVSTVRFHLDQLVAGQALSTAYERRGVGRPRKVYSLAATADPSDVERERHSLALLTELLTTMVAAQGSGTVISPEDAGEKWAAEHVDANASSDPARTPGEWLGKVGALTDVLRDWGYVRTITTTREQDEADIRLTHCPFRELAKANPAVVCGIHRGLIKGTMAKLGEHTTDSSLRPFAEGDVCIAHLTQNHPAAPDKES